MTTSRPLPTQALLRAAKALRFSLIIQGFVRWAVLSAGGLLALLLLDNLLHLPQALRLPLAVVLGGFIAVEFYRKIAQHAFHKLSPARAARLLEMNRGISGNVLINAYQFENSKSSAEQRKYVSALFASSGAILGDIAPESLWLTPRLKKWAMGLVALVAAWGLIGFAFPRYVTNGMERIFLPLADIPPVGNWAIDVEPKGKVALVEGDKLDVTVHLTSQTGLSLKPPTPLMVWQEGTGSSESSANAGEHASMLPGAKPGDFVFSFSAVSQPFTFRVWVDDSRSSSVRVDVSPLPQIKQSTFEVTPPAYTGLKPYLQPGAPATLDVPQGSIVKATLQLSTDSPKVTWRGDKTSTDMSRTSSGWELTQTLDETLHYNLLVALPGQGPLRQLGQGEMTVVADHPPEVDFVAKDRNHAVNPGDVLPVTIRATDDYGVAWTSLRIAPSDDPTSARVIKTWTYLGPPGQTQPTPETFSIQLDPAVFTPGSTFLLTAQAGDFSPAQQKTTSRPIIIRVAGLQDMAVPQGDVLEKLFELLKNTIVQQTQANGLTDNLVLHLAEALSANDLPQHFGGMTKAQKLARETGSLALDEAGNHDEGKIYVAKLETLVKGEMDLAIGQLGDLPKADPDNLTPTLTPLHTRQAYILNELTTLLGRMASERQQASVDAAKKSAATPLPPAVKTQEQLAKLKDELKTFGDEQKRIISATNTLKELNPEDLTTEQQTQMGDLAREEAKQAAFFREKLTDLSKVPLQDFADGKIVSDMNEVFQEVQEASKSLYQKRAELAVPSETNGLEAAKKIEQNLEKWLPNTPDNTKWSMEEPPGGKADVPMAELPKQLDDLVGDLLHKEKELDQDKDDVSSSIMDSLDKGAGWGASDGPMSNMSAKGVTGNQMPNNDEISGRSGEGRNGKSDGQMVGNTAVGKGGAETPTRETPTPFENGSVDDKSKDDKGGATGGGKLAGAGEDGLRGPMAPQVQQKLRILAEQQTKLRQQAESLALQLHKQRRPTGDLESAINSMKQLEAAAKSENGLGVVQGYHQALDSLQSARESYAGDRLSRVEADNMVHGAHKDMFDTQSEETPAGYEEMTGAYFRSLSDSSAPATPAADDAAAPDASASPTTSVAPAPTTIPTTSATPAAAVTPAAAPTAATAPVAPTAPASTTPAPAK